MNLTQIISILVFASWPIIFVVSSHIARRPERQHQILAQFAPIAVQQVEQQSYELSGSAKKQLAFAFLAKAFKAAHLPPLPEEIVDAAIEAAVFTLPEARRK